MSGCGAARHGSVAMFPDFFVLAVAAMGNGHNPPGQKPPMTEKNIEINIKTLTKR